jgi:hypothetical protein
VRSPEVQAALCALHHLFPLMCSLACGPELTSLPVHHRSVISPPTFIQLLQFAWSYPSVNLTSPTRSYWLAKIPSSNWSSLASMYPSNWLVRSCQYVPK